MKLRSKLFVLLMVILLTLSIVTPAFAGGDQVRGDKGTGTVIQWQNYAQYPYYYIALPVGVLADPTMYYCY